MDFAPSATQQAVRDAVARICAAFRRRLLARARPRRRLSRASSTRRSRRDGWLGIGMPEAYGGAGPRHRRGRHDDAGRRRSPAPAMAGASAVHMNIFGLNPVVMFGTEEQKRRMLPPLIAGRSKRLLRRHRARCRARHHAAQDPRRARRRPLRRHGQKIWISTAQVAEKMLLLARTTPLEEVRSRTDGLSLFYTTLDRATSRCARSTRWAARRSIRTSCSSTAWSAGRGPHRRGRQGLRLHPARPEPRAHPDRRRGGRHRPRRAAPRRRYAKERVVFGRPIGQNQAIQHPLAECWIELEAANLMMLQAAWLYDAGSRAAPRPTPPNTSPPRPASMPARRR